MSHTAPQSKPAQPSTALKADDATRELIAAMPIVIFANAIRDALNARRASSRNEPGRKLGTVG